MAREKGTGSLQLEKSGRWTMRVGIKGKRYSRSTRTTDREKAEKFLERFLSPLGLGSRRLPLADVWLEYVKSPDRRDLAPSTLNAKRFVWIGSARSERRHARRVQPHCRWRVQSAGLVGRGGEGEADGGHEAAGDVLRAGRAEPPGRPVGAADAQGE